MKKLMIIIGIIISANVNAQILEPVKWSTSVNKISATKSELVATLTIDYALYLYSQSVPENGPIPTKFVFEGNGNYLKKGNTQEGEGHTI
jgi:hypothetical protein